jgi:hypothetical protein
MDTNDFDEYNVEKAQKILTEFYELIDGLKKEFPDMLPQQFKKLIMEDDDLNFELQDLVNEFKSSFKIIDTKDKVVLDILIALSTIGIEIQK